MNRRLAPIVLAAVLVLAACSGDSADQSSITPPDATGDAAATAATANVSATASPEASTATSGVTNGTLRHDGIERTYRLFVPADAAVAMPLVVGLHGGARVR